MSAETKITVEEIKQVTGRTKLSVNTAVDTNNKFIPSFVLLNLAINKKTKELLDELRVHAASRTYQRQEELIANHVAEATVVGVDAYEANRFDTSGYKQSDSGKPVFGWDGVDGFVTLDRIVADLEAMGFRMTEVHTLHKPGSHSNYLRLGFRQEGEVARMDSEAKAVARRLLSRFYQKLHVYRNPGGSVTFNPSVALDQGQAKPEIAMQRVRMDVDGEIRVEPV